MDDVSEVSKLYICC